MGVDCNLPIVLVHGSFVTATAWDATAQGLRRLGRVVAVAELHRGSLSADTAAVQEVVDDVGGTAVICGWSYGGNVITGLQLDESSHLVYLCAMMPDEGESAISIGTHYPGGINELIGLDDAGDLMLSGDNLDAIMWGDADAESARLARHTLRPQAMVSFAEPTRRVAWREIPSTLVIGSGDRVYNPEMLQLMATRATNVIEWDTSHSPPVSAPNRVVELLHDLATQPR